MKIYLHVLFAVVMDARLVEMPALGRPLYPGMLYDCRSDSFIPGVTLWDKTALREDLDIRPQPKTDLKFSASDSLNEKTNLLDVNASLKASFMGGLVEVGGSAKYLRDTKSSAQQERVTMHFSQTTRFEQLTMAELGKITYPQVFDQQTATHVITAVLYGAQAFMVFDHTAANDEDKQDIAGNLHVLIKKIPSFSIEGDADLKMTDSEKKMADNISVTFYGDYELERSPTTFKEAIEIYSTLPHLLREKNNAVPVRVWLYPLRLLNEKAARMVREISESLVSKTEHVLEELGEVERRCNDLIRDRRVEDFLDLKGRLQMFQDLHSDHKIAFQKAIFRVLPTIRSGTEDELKLTNILSSQYRSPFAAKNLNQWLDNITTELNILSSYIRGLKDVRVVTSSGLLNAILFEPDIDVVVCLCFTSLKYKDTYLDTLKECSKVFETPEQASEEYALQDSQPWFTSPDISKNMRQNLSLFTSFSKANQNEKRIQFVIASISDPDSPGTSIRLYKNGELIDPKFQPVSKPPPPIVEIQDEAVILKLQKSPTGETLRFRVEYRMVKEGESNQEEDWKTTDTPDAQSSFKLPGLQPGKQYLIRYKAVSAVGVSESSETAPPVVTDACALVGGTGGNEQYLFQEIGVNLKKIVLFPSKNTVNALQVTLSNSQEILYGTWSGLSSIILPFQEFEFHDGDRFRSLTLWPDKYGDRLGGVQFEVVRQTGETEKFSAQIPNIGQPVSIDVGSGVCYGIKVRSGVEVDALGFFFVNQI